jgi:hypothetical protein
MPSIKDRRQAPRYRLHINAEIHTSTFYINGTILDISVEGIRVETFLTIEPGTLAAVHFKIEKEIVFKGQVLWALGLRKRGHDLYHIGIKVDNMAVAGIKVLGFDIKNDLIQEILTALERKSKRPD